MITKADYLVDLKKSLDKIEAALKDVIFETLTNQLQNIKKEAEIILQHNNITFDSTGEENTHLTVTEGYFNATNETAADQYSSTNVSTTANYGGLINFKYYVEGVIITPLAMFGLFGK